MNNDHTLYHTIFNLDHHISNYNRLKYNLKPQQTMKNALEEQKIHPSISEQTNDRAKLLRIHAQ